MIYEELHRKTSPTSRESHIPIFLCKVDHEVLVYMDFGGGQYFQAPYYVDSTDLGEKAATEPLAGMDFDRFIQADELDR